MSSRTARVFFVSSLLFAGFTVWGVHYMQQRERDLMYQGVVKDEARMAAKKKQREEEFRESMRKRELYESVQSVAGASNGSELRSPTSS